MIDFTFISDIETCASQVKLHGTEYHAAIKSLGLSFIKAQYSGQLQDNLIVVLDGLDELSKKDFVKSITGMDVLKSIRVKKGNFEIDRIHKAFLSQEAFSVLGNMTSCREMEKYIKSVLSVFKEKKTEKSPLEKIIDLLDKLGGEDLVLCKLEIEERLKKI